MNRIPRARLIAPSRAVMRVFAGPRPSSIVLRLAILVVVPIVTSCDSPSPSPQLANGWVTNCAGAEFSRFSQNGTSGPGPDRPVFRINDQLVLAVPAKYRPNADSIDREPSECRKISDLPPAHFLAFVIWGNWSAGYKPEDVPTIGANKQFQPDVVSVRIQPEIPSKLSAQEQQKIKQLIQESLQHDSTGTREIGDLTCFVPKPGMTWTDCSGNRTKSDLDLRYRPYSATSFVLVQADYASPRSGGIHVFWQTWTSDVSHALDIDAAIWNLLADWNLFNKADAQAGRR